MNSTYNQQYLVGILNSALSYTRNWKVIISNLGWVIPNLITIR
jgi:hypothetical protein